MRCLPESGCACRDPAGLGFPPLSCSDLPVWTGLTPARGRGAQDETIEAQAELKDAVGRVGSDVDDTRARVSEAGPGCHARAACEDCLRTG